MAEVLSIPDITAKFRDTPKELTEEEETSLIEAAIIEYDKNLSSSDYSAIFKLFFDTYVEYRKRSYKTEDKSDHYSALQFGQLAMMLYSNKLISNDPIKLLRTAISDDKYRMDIIAGVSSSRMERDPGEVLKVKPIFRIENMDAPDN